MKKYDSVQEYIKGNGQTVENMKDTLLTTALDMLSECAHNFSGDAAATEKAALPLIWLNDILDTVK